jgi:MYXO-CTERM domain-containing protein
MKCWLFPMVATCIVAIAIPASARTITVDDHIDDYGYGIGLPPNTKPTWEIGAGSYPDQHQRNVFYIFELPTLASNEVVTSADLAFQYTYRNWTPNYNVDLWGVGFQDSTTPIQEFFNEDSGDTGNTKIDDNLITASTSYGSISTSKLGDAALGSYVQSFYDANPDYSGGDYVFLRLNHDALPGSANYTRVSRAESTSGSPVLTLNTAVPEPSALVALTGLLGMGLIGRWRRRRR